MDSTPAEPVLVPRDGVLVDGPDALTWLQGQLTQDLDGLAMSETRHSLVLSPQGKLVSLCRVSRIGEDTVLLDTEVGFGEDLFGRLKMFKLRVKATLERVAVVAPRSDGGWDGLGAPVLVPQGAELAGATPGPGDAAGSGGPDRDLAEYERVSGGVPRLGAELTERTIPQEGGAEFVARTVSFTKGCYTGQELVARLDARGSNVPRQLRVVRGTGAPPAVGTAIVAGEADVGELTSVATDPASPGDWAALAFVKRAALSAEPVRVLVSGATATILAPTGSGPGQAE